MQTKLKSAPRLIVLSAILAVTLSGCAGNSTRAFVGMWGDETDTSSPSLNLSSDGDVSGTDGCNRLRGSWTEESGIAKFGPLASTRMACSKVDTWLSQATSAKIVDGSLVVSGPDGTEIGTLSPSK